MWRPTNVKRPHFFQLQIDPSENWPWPPFIYIINVDTLATCSTSPCFLKSYKHTYVYKIPWLVIEVGLAVEMHEVWWGKLSCYRRKPSAVLDATTGDLCKHPCNVWNVHDSHWWAHCDILNLVSVWHPIQGLWSTILKFIFVLFLIVPLKWAMHSNKKKLLAKKI